MRIFPYMAFVYAWIVPSWADQLLPQLLMEQFETLPSYIELMREGVWFGKKYFFDEMTTRSAGLNYHLPQCKFITLPYCAGISNKHCLLTFFIFS